MLYACCARLGPVAKAKAGLVRCSRAPVGRCCLPGTQVTWPNQPGQHIPVIRVIMHPVRPSGDLPVASLAAPFLPLWANGHGPWWYPGWYPGALVAWPGTVLGRARGVLCSVRVGWPRALSQLLLPCGLQLVLLCLAVVYVRGLGILE
jgi:hypothetical protein